MGSVHAMNYLADAVVSDDIDVRCLIEDWFLMRCHDMLVELGFFLRLLLCLTLELAFQVR